MNKQTPSDRQIIKKFEAFSDADLLVMIGSIYNIYMLEKVSYDAAMSILVKYNIAIAQEPTYFELKKRYETLKRVCKLRGIEFIKPNLAPISIDNVIIELRTILSEEIKWIREHSYILKDIPNEQGYIFSEEEIIKKRKEQFESIIKKLTQENIALKNKKSML